MHNYHIILWSLQQYLSQLMKQSDKQNMVLIINKTIKNIQQQLELANEGKSLPPLSPSKQHPSNSLKTRNTIEVGSFYSNQLRTSKQPKQQQISKPKQYNIQFKKKSHELTLVRRGKPSSKTLLNSTSMKMKMNGGWRSVRQTPNKYTLSTIEGGSDDKIKTVMINSDIIGLYDGGLSPKKNFNPKFSKMDLSKNQPELMDKYVSRFQDIKQINKKGSSGRRNNIQQISQKSQKLLNQEELLQSIQPMKKRRYNHSIHNRSPEKHQPDNQLILIQTNKQLKPRHWLNNREPEQQYNYTPWQSYQKQHPHYIQQQMNDNIF